MILSSSVNLLPDKTIFFQLAIFLLVAVALNYFIFKPTLNILRLRRSKTEGEKQKLEELHQKTQNLVKEYEEKIEKAKQEGFKIKESIRKEGEVQGQKMIHEAKKTSLDELEKVKNEIEKATEASAKKLEEEAKVFGQSLAEKILGRH